MITTLSDLKNFELQGAEVTVWVLKRPRSNGRRRFSGRWIGITDDLAERLRETVRANLDGISETIEYDVLVQNNEASALTIGADETDAHMIASQVMDPTPDLKARELPDLRDSDFYVARFAHGEAAMLAVRKTDPSWSTRRSHGLIRIVFSDEELDVEENPVFTIRPDFDFFVLNERIFIRSKPRFESLLSYKAGHAEAFEVLTAEVEFAAIFADMRRCDQCVVMGRLSRRRPPVRRASRPAWSASRKLTCRPGSGECASTRLGAGLGAAGSPGTQRWLSSRTACPLWFVEAHKRPPLCIAHVLWACRKTS